MPERLPIDKPQALVHCGAGIERGLESFFGVREAMATIREKRLSKADYKILEEYGRDRRGMSRIPAHRCMESAHVVPHSLPMGNIPDKEEARQRRVEGLGKKMGSMPIPEGQPQRTTCPSKRNGWAACIRSKVKLWGRTVIRRNGMVEVWRGLAEKGVGIKSYKGYWRTNKQQSKGEIFRVLLWWGLLMQRLSGAKNDNYGFKDY